MCPFWSGPSPHPNSLSSRTAAHKPPGSHNSQSYFLGRCKHPFPTMHLPTGSASPREGLKICTSARNVAIREVWETAFQQHQAAVIPRPCYIFPPHHLYFRGGTALPRIPSPCSGPLPDFHWPAHGLSWCQWVLFSPPGELPSWPGLLRPHGALGINYSDGTHWRFIIICLSPSANSNLEPRHCALCIFLPGGSAPCWRPTWCSLILVKERVGRRNTGAN